MTKIMQNLVLFIEPPTEEYRISLKAGNMCLNRFCIDEDASFELFWVYNAKKSSNKVADKIRRTKGLKAKGKVNYCE